MVFTWNGSAPAGSISRKPPKAPPTALWTSRRRAERRSHRRSWRASTARDRRRRPRSAFAPGTPARARPGAPRSARSSPPGSRPREAPRQRGAGAGPNAGDDADGFGHDARPLFACIPRWRPAASDATIINDVYHIIACQARGTERRRLMPGAGCGRRATAHAVQCWLEAAPSRAGAERLEKT